MQGDLKAFQIMVNDKLLDYRLGEKLDLSKAESFFKRKYFVRKLWSGGRHILGILEKDNKLLFLKLATTKGISAITENEYAWNKQFNKLVSRKSSDFWVPQNKECGLYNNLFYLITDNLEGGLLVRKPGKIRIPKLLLDNISSVIQFSELIQKLDIANLKEEENLDYRKYFFDKTISWYKGIPGNIVEKYRVKNLLAIIEQGMSGLQKRPRHGDFTPWHLIKLPSGQLGLIDGEHAMDSGVEYYDIGYFIQRVFSVLENPKLAEKILSILLKNNYNLEKIRVILAARSIGGFLDESLKPSPNYEFSNKFKDWVIRL
ncbi:TPA: hypothetical protein DD690_03175 [Candidatus Daviesbacteria bacterium]|uniref:Aminoglycoside phosphotransferase domain-containing protein n=1 Tax=Candidatus Daviesbacteria bacterium GW2011_GWF2_38_6 TaxID=1618432 RepID=A0A0G0MXS1_9BACT|nr:MAG: hypothetical protein US80_C0005G0012 [Candidatus Daviesbacteria bacterium GW2011_GWA2_38_17]KKQ78449.1 MAG: hypothetical protein US99_C0021G0006 [Candidatus Daviesbacteria bacterium GW2011_GWF2_38_6]OGE27193.1 MAG: hypothetical protein A3D02_00895 [Candidatus Daviesbacteria bacterium RIFCSPHIGHO2_02_FULL_39_41]OGE29389.1 MAG: hypothetical protein A2772_02040 [Candidatus Daviesbacteria bacterium RIFCSPHIGHO2_01_FULL_38_8b]OGE45966.1 MAG: hypothetical protein A3E67_02845 [Candidatus Davie